MAAIIAFIYFAVFQRRKRRRKEKDEEMAAGAAAAAALDHDRFADDADHPVVRPRRGTMRTRSPWLDDGDQQMAQVAGPIMYGGRDPFGDAPNQFMNISREQPYPSTPHPYVLASGISDSPSPPNVVYALPPNTGDSAPSPSYASAYGGMAPPRSTTPGNASLNSSGHHGTTTYRPSTIGHPPSSYTQRHSPAQDSSEGHDPSVVDPFASKADPPEPSRQLDSIYPPAYQAYATDVGYAYEPDPVEHQHEIMPGLPVVNPEGDAAPSPHPDHSTSVLTRSIYSQDDWSDDHEDPRLDPIIRLRNGMASEISMGLRDHEDYSRRVMVSFDEFSFTLC